MPAILNGYVHFNLAKAGDSDALLREGEVLTSGAAKLVNLSPERIRQICKKHSAARWIGRLI
jgi:hypothetical protein